MMTITSVGHLNEDDRLGNLNVKDLKSTLEGSSSWGVVTLSGPRPDGSSPSGVITLMGTSPCGVVTLEGSSPRGVATRINKSLGVATSWPRCPLASFYLSVVLVEDC